MAHWVIRYALAIVAVLVAWGIGWIGKAVIGHNGCLLALLIAIFAGSILGGFGPGMVATSASLLMGLALPQNLSISQLCLLAVQGILISIMGGWLRLTRLKARARLADRTELEQQILEISDEERRRIGHDLHDGLGQHLAGISLRSETIARQLENGQAPDSANVETITRLVSEAVGITRDIAKTLSPVTLEQDGLLAALEELAETSSSLLRMNCTCEFDVQELPLDRTRSLHLFRIVQEAISNSVRHGKARNITISLKRNGNNLAVTVVDDGSGLSQKTSMNPGIGLRIMQYRARRLGAVLSAERAAAEGGTRITCICPING